MSNFVSYECLSSSPIAFTSQISNVDISKNAHDALNVSEWKEVVFEEMRALKKNKTWEVVTLPKRKSTIDYKWVFNG